MNVLKDIIVVSQVRVPDQMYCILLAPTGMAAYHLKGNTIHSGLHININRGKLVPLGNSEKNTLRSKLLEAKVLFVDEISMVGTRLWQKVNQRLQEIFGSKRVVWRFTCHSNWRFLPNGSCFRCIPV